MPRDKSMDAGKSVDHPHKIHSLFLPILSHAQLHPPEKLPLKACYFVVVVGARREFLHRIAMRLFVGHHLLSVLLFFLNIGCTSAGINTSCLKVVTALAARPGDLFAKFQEHVCDAGCRPTVPHWDLWTRNNTFLPAVRGVTKRLDAPRHEEAMIKLGDEAADRIKRRCGPLLHGGDLCSDSETLAGFGNCFKTNFVRTAIMNLPTLLPMVSEEVCREQYEYLKTDTLWEEIIPNNMREYASVCQSLGDGVPQLEQGMVHEEL
ncbi:hypothetical protein BDV26DRAFT_259979 [Aspergillus bertholletiae]|uniref:Uncharacterized protein n=1 Tax=Aspergillus bertholletiae TaxID=1226010 RepID=A0A5N7BBR5_9EURO|nr:hypothetical protein BDV26DRAFT_259979 [Aspergillus bertholletiae]